MAQGESDRNLLFGVLALQMDFITRDALIAAMNAWVLEKNTPLGRILVARGDLDEDDFALLDPLVAKHIERHGGDPERSLESLSSVSWLRQHLPAMADPGLTASLMHLGVARNGESGAEETTSLSVGDASSAGQRFRILRPHASGGLGEVYVARDAELNREVALKQIKGGHADHPDSRSRFLLEAEITGGLEHPGIVPVYGLGHYPDGRPFYAMRFIRGDSLKEAIERFHRADKQPGRDPGERALALRQLLRRFVDVCNAVAYAHSRGVLHRDLKPGNVMLGPYGETLVVDWGLAKPIGRAEATGPTAEGTLRPSSGSGLAPTQIGSALGTPAYMSPEQAAGRLDELGPASDVYSLGAMLYSLLTGRSPFTDTELGDMLRKVQAGEFPPPRSVNRAVSPALEAVCLKAMANDPGDRYGSPRRLADDVEHWLGDEPVTAWREPLVARGRRWMRRHRTMMTGALAAILVGLVGLASVATVQNRSNWKLRQAYLKVSDSLAAEKTANEKASLALAAETRAKQEKEGALAQSEEARKRAEAVLGFLRYDVLAAARPEGRQGGLGVGVTVHKAIDAAEPKIAAEFKDHPLVEAEVRDTMGKTYAYLGDAPGAIRQHQRAAELRAAKLGSDHPDTLESRNNLAQAYDDGGRTADAIRLLEETLELRASKLGRDHLDTLRTRNSLAVAYNHARRTKEAITMLEETLRLREAKLGADDPDTLNSRNNLAVAYEKAGRTADAIRMHEQTLRLREAKLGRNHLDTLASRNNLAVAYEKAGRIADSIRLKEEVLKGFEEKLGRDHRSTLTIRNNLAIAYRADGRLAQAIRMLEETLRQREQKLGPDDPDTLGSRNNLASAYQADGRLAQAIAMKEEVLARMEARLGRDHPDTLTIRNNLATAYLADGRALAAIPLLEETLKLGEIRLGPDHPDTLQSRNNLAAAYFIAGRAAAAIPLFEETLRLRETKLGPDHPDTFQSRDNLAVVYGKAGRSADAERLKRDTLTRRRRTQKADAPLLAGDLAQLGDHLMRQAKWMEAEPVLRECLAIVEKIIPDDWSRFNTMSQLGGALLGQGRYSEAEPLVIKGYEGMKARKGRIPPQDKPRLPEAADRVVRLYEAWDKPEKAAEWKARLGLSDLPAEVFAPP